MSILSNEKYWTRLPQDYAKFWNWNMCDYGCMILVKDQKECDMCWAIATTDCVAMGFKIKGIHLTLNELSLKDMLDCADREKWNCLKCFPYSLKKAFMYMAEIGVMREQDYPFRPEKSPCRAKTPDEMLNLVKIVGFATINPKDEKRLMDAVMQYPICGGVRHNKAFMKVKGEIYEGPTAGNELLHAIIIIGFGFEENPDKRFWIVKNSYGTTWGDEGYGKIARQSSMGKDKEPLILRTMRPLFERDESALVGLKKMAWHRKGNLRFWNI